jgi:hypothetical protein
MRIPLSPFVGEGIKGVRGKLQSMEKEDRFSLSRGLRQSGRNLSKYP